MKASDVITKKEGELYLGYTMQPLTVETLVQLYDKGLMTDEDYEEMAAELKEVRYENVA